MSTFVGNRGYILKIEEQVEMSRLAPKIGSESGRGQCFAATLTRVTTVANDDILRRAELAPANSAPSGLVPPERALRRATVLLGSCVAAIEEREEEILEEKDWKERERV